MNYSKRQIMRFWSNVEQSGPDDCWLWLKSQNNGYGQVGMTVNGQQRLLKAHKVAWEIQNKRSIPFGVRGLHSCGDRLCCNPRHVYLKGASAPMGTHRRARGQRHGKSKLTDDQVRMIKYKLTELTTREISNLFPIGYHAIWEIRNNITWKHI